MHEWTRFPFSWQATAVVVGALLVPCGGWLLYDGLLVCRTDFAGYKILFGIVVFVPAFTGVVLAFYSRFRLTTSRAERLAIFYGIGWGVAFLAGGVLLTVLSGRYATVRLGAENYYLVPTCLYITGLILFGRAFNPPNR